MQARGAAAATTRLRQQRFFASSARREAEAKPRRAGGLVSRRRYLAPAAGSSSARARAGARSPCLERRPHQDRLGAAVEANPAQDAGGAPGAPAGRCGARGEWARARLASAEAFFGRRRRRRARPTAGGGSATRRRSLGARSPRATGLDRHGRVVRAGCARRVGGDRRTSRWRRQRRRHRPLPSGAAARDAEASSRPSHAFNSMVTARRGSPTPAEDGARLRIGGHGVVPGLSDLAERTALDRQRGGGAAALGGERSRSPSQSQPSDLVERCPRDDAQVIDGTVVTRRVGRRRHRQRRRGGGAQRRRGGGGARGVATIGCAARR